MHPCCYFFLLLAYRYVALLSLWRDVMETKVGSSPDRLLPSLFHRVLHSTVWGQGLEMTS